MDTARNDIAVSIQNQDIDKYIKKQCPLSLALIDTVFMRTTYERVLKIIQKYTYIHYI